MNPPKVAYVMKGFPRLSETFIAHEIYQLERLGVQLKLFSVKREREAQTHPVVAALRSPLTYLPPATSLSGAGMPRWLLANLPAFARAHIWLALNQPRRYARALRQAIDMSRRYRAAEPKAAPRKVFIKEFVQAGQIAADVLRAGDVGHLHGHFCHGVATITWFVSQLTGLPFSFTAHAKDIYQVDQNPGDLLERKLDAARFVATCTCANAEVLRARHSRPDDVHAIYHGLDTDYFRPASSAGAAPSHAAPAILAVGRFVAKKGFDNLVEACAILKRNGVRFECRIVGERGDAYDDIGERIEGSGLTDIVKRCAPLTQDQLRELYRQATVFVLPCQVTADGDRDGFPNVLAEAMAMGVPVITTPISGIPEMIEHDRHGLLVPPGDPVSLARALTRLLEDPALAERLSRAGRARICERFDSRRTTVVLAELFKAQLEQAARAVGASACEQTGALAARSSS